MTVGLQNLSNQNFYGVRAAVPPYEEQVAIVNFAERQTQAIRTAIVRLGREIELLREYRIRLVADVVTGKLDVREAAGRLPDATYTTDGADHSDISDQVGDASHDAEFAAVTEEDDG